jgi:paraquat-inducible protein B
MSEISHANEPNDIPEAVVAPKKRGSLQIVWLIPIVAILIGGWLAVKSILEKGPTITISFKSAEGLDAGKTKLKYKDVEVGLVKTVTLSKDLGGVIATAEVVNDFDPHLLDDTRFWVVRPRISGGNVSGLGTLLSGSYIGADAGRNGKSRKEFVGLEVPPVVQIDTPGRQFVLRSDTIGSVDVGSPIFYRRLQAGQVQSYELDKDGKQVTVKVFINAPYDTYVTQNTRFWNASGVDVKLDASGIKVDTESLMSILIGGLAFETPEPATGVTQSALTQAAAGATFALFENRAAAMKNPETEVLKLLMVFNESARGLSPGAPVDFRGVIVGEVAAIQLDVNRVTRRVENAVLVNVYPDRMRARSRQHIVYEGAEKQREFMDAMAAHGMRAQLRTGSLLTGQLYVAVDFFPKAAPAKINWASAPAEIPTVQGSLAELQQAIGSIAAKIEKLPLEQISADLRQTLQGATKLINNVDSNVTPDLRHTLQASTKLMQNIDTSTLPELREALLDVRKTLGSADRLLASNSPLQSDAREAMRQISRAAQTFRVLADYLEQHPEALLRGKSEAGQ